MRNTKQRELILDIILKSRNHLTASEVYEIAKKDIPNISLGTVYRILNKLSDDHIILRIMTKSGTDHFDRLPDKHHDHFICTKCGKIIDIFNAKSSYDKKELSNMQIDSLEIIFSGICNDCLKERKIENGTKRIKN